MAYLWDHVVAGRQLLPAAAMLESAAAAASTCLGSGAGLGQLALEAVAVPTPLVLPATLHKAAVLGIDIACTTGDVVVSSQSGASSRLGAPHLTAWAALVSGAPAECQLAPSGVTKILLGQPLAPMKPAPTAFGGIALPCRTQPNETDMHPAIIDNITQVGSALAAASKEGGVTRVPVGTAVYSPTSIAMDASAGMHATSQLAGLSPDGSAFSDYALMQRQRGACRILGMQFKPLQRPSVQRKIAAEGRHSSALYTIAWQAQSPAEVGAASRRLPSTGILVWSGGKGQLHAPTHSTAAGLRFLQKAIAGPTGQYQLITRSALAGTPTCTAGQLTNLSATGSAGLLRVAAQEASLHKWSHLDIASSAAWIAEAPMDADAFGAVQGAGYWLAPRLEQAAPQSTEGMGPPQLVGHGMAITGGLGNIGLLLGAWNAQQSSTNHILLLGRSGQGTLPATLTRASCLVTALQCNVASREDVGELARWSAAQGVQLQTIMHAGGVVADNGASMDAVQISLANLAFGNLAASSFEQKELEKQVIC